MMDRSTVGHSPENAANYMNHQNSSAVALTTAVNHSQMRVSNNPAETLVAFSIGSGIGIAVYDLVTNVGGLLNFLLPESASIQSPLSKKCPFTFADTGIPAFFSALEALGAGNDRLKVVITGAAKVMDQNGAFNVGQHNYRATKSILLGYAVDIHHEDIGGIHPRTLKLNIENGDIFINLPGRSELKI
jgi:chemotaxis protein CheD